MCSTADDSGFQYARPEQLFPPDLASTPERYSKFRQAAQNFIKAVRRVGASGGPPPPGAGLPGFPALDFEMMATRDMLDLVGAWHALGCVAGWAEIAELTCLLDGLMWFARVFREVAERSGYHGMEVGEAKELRFVFVPSSDPDSYLVIPESQPHCPMVDASEDELQAIEAALDLLPSSLAGLAGVDRPAGQMQGAEWPRILRDKATEERDRFIYEQCCAGMPYGQIAAEVNKNSDWAPLETKNGAKDAAKRYAQRHQLPAPPRRQRGRPSSKK